MTSNRTVAATLGLILLVSFTGGCEELDQASETGSRRNLTFTIDAGGPLADFDTPVAIGALIDVQVKGIGGESVTVREAGFRIGRTFEVVGFRGDVITVRALDRGDGTLEVVVDGPDGELEDSARLAADHVETVGFSHDCNLAEGKPAHYMVGTAPWVGLTLRNDRYEKLIGYGFAPVSFAPEGLVELDEGRSDTSRLYFTAPDQTGDITVRSTVNDASVTFRFVEVDAIDEIKVNGVEFVHMDAVSPTRKVWPLVDGNRVCRSSVVPTVTNPGDAHCTVSMKGEPGDDHAKLDITPLSLGDCMFTLGIDETGLRTDFQLRITD